jgi:hypothetical protein
MRFPARSKEAMGCRMLGCRPSRLGEDGYRLFLVCGPVASLKKCGARNEAVGRFQVWAAMHSEV